jgi:hypothetical protein
MANRRQLEDSEVTRYLEDGDQVEALMVFCNCDKNYISYLEGGKLAPHPNCNLLTRVLHPFISHCPYRTSDRHNNEELRDFVLAQQLLEGDPAAALVEMVKKCECPIRPQALKLAANMDKKMVDYGGKIRERSTKPICYLCNMMGRQHVAEVECCRPMCKLHAYGHYCNPDMIPDELQRRLATISQSE